MAKQYSIVGSNFVKAEEFIKTLAVGTEVVLVREPTNAFDPNAVAIWAEGRKVGYVPKTQNAVLAKFIDDTGRGYSWGVAMDQELTNARFIPAKFVRSPNSGYPMVEV